MSDLLARDELLIGGSDLLPGTAGAAPALLPPGIHHGIPADAYHALPYCSNSRLTLLQRSPAHLQAELAAPREATPAMKLGTAVHMAVLEPERFWKHYTAAGQCNGIKKDGARCSNPGTHRVSGEWRCGVHPLAGERDALEVLPAADLAACEGIGAALHSHPRIRPLLCGPGDNELTVVWDDPETGVRCKARIDRLTTVRGHTALVDVKSVDDARDDSWQRRMAQRGHHRQLAMYEQGLRAYGVDVSDCVFVAVERDAPFAACGFRVPQIDLELGREELTALLATYALCESKGEWPSYPTEIREVGLPAWYYRRDLADAA